MVVIRGTAWSQMIRHCTATAPIEAVGMLTGRDDIAECCETLRNIAPAPENLRAFLADPYEQFVAERRMAAHELKLVAIYHSHPDGGTTMSAEDIEFSRNWACPQIVVALATGTPNNVALRAFRLVDDRVTEVPISIQQ
jgi:proteasome lid subunit RPN8/RPN11